MVKAFDSGPHRYRAWGIQVIRIGAQTPVIRVAIK